jgi:lipoprotein-anchoring transpeptidase ErfK/SrfK
MNSALDNNLRTNMIRHLMAAVLTVAFGTTSLPPLAFAATKPTDEKALLLKKKKATEVKVQKKKLLEAEKRADALKKLKAQKAALQNKERSKKLVDRRTCKGFLQCMFGSRKVRVTRDGAPAQYASLSAAGLSGRKSRRAVDWNESRYPVGSIIVKTPERALYLVTGSGEAIRYSVGVGKEGFQWSGNSKIVRKQEWPSWTPPKVMIEREAAKGHIIPPFMEGGPGNPLGARALYIGGGIYRVHGTNNEASIGGAVSSGCIRMMNADVIDLYERVKVGARIYVYQ